MKGPRSDRPTDSEYGSESEPAAGVERGDRESGLSTTVRANVEDHSTLRLGTAAAGLGNEPPWRTRYEDLGEIARGGMSVIRDMFDRVIRRHVAMKILDRERDPAGLTQFIPYPHSRASTVSGSGTWRAESSPCSASSASVSWRSARSGGGF